MASDKSVTVSDGVRIHVTDDGSGSPVLFLHEYAGDHRSWSRQVSGLAGDFRCITYAARGYQPSDVPADPACYSWERAVQDAVDVLEALQVSACHVVGLSMGGYTALQLARLHPDRVRSAMAVSTGSGSDPETRAAYLEEASTVAEQLRSGGTSGIGARMAVGPSRIQLKNRNEPVWHEFVEQFTEHSAEGLALTVLGVQRARPSLWDQVDELSRIAVPLLVVNGDEDEACLSTGLLLKRSITTCGLLVLPHSGHVPNLENPEQFNGIVRNFIQRVESAEWPERDSRSRAESQFGLDRPAGAEA